MTANTPLTTVSLTTWPWRLSVVIGFLLRGRGWAPTWALRASPGETKLVMPLNVTAFSGACCADATKNVRIPTNSGSHSGPGHRFRSRAAIPDPGSHSGPGHPCQLIGGGGPGLGLDVASTHVDALAARAGIESIRANSALPAAVRRRGSSHASARSRLRSNHP